MADIVPHNLYYCMKRRLAIPFVITLDRPPAILYSILIAIQFFIAFLYSNCLLVCYSVRISVRESNSFHHTIVGGYYRYIYRPAKHTQVPLLDEYEAL